MTTSTKDKDGKLNNWAKEPTMYVGEEFKDQESHNVRAESWNSKAAMLGVVSALISYSITGKLFFGIF
jgi:hypothetical protein